MESFRLNFQKSKNFKCFQKTYLPSKWSYGPQNAVFTTLPKTFQLNAKKNVVQRDGIEWKTHHFSNKSKNVPLDRWIAALATPLNTFWQKAEFFRLFILKAKKIFLIQNKLLPKRISYGHVWCSFDSPAISLTTKSGNLINQRPWKL